MRKINKILFTCLIVAGMTACGSGGDKYHITVKCGEETMSEGDAQIGWTASGGNTTGFFGFGKSEKAKIKILGVSDAVKEAENVEDVVGQKFDCEIKIGDVEAESGLSCTITSFEEESGGRNAEMFGQQYIMKGSIEGDFNGKAITEGSFSIMTYKKDK